MNKKKKEGAAASMDNIYKLNGKVPVAKAIPFGLQHILAMFVANIAPILIVAGVCNISEQEKATLIQCAMLIAGIGTLIQLFPVWRIGFLDCLSLWESVLPLYLFSVTSEPPMAMAPLWERCSSAVSSRDAWDFWQNTGRRSSRRSCLPL